MNRHFQELGSRFYKQFKNTSQDNEEQHKPKRNPFQEYEPNEILKRNI